MVYGLAAVAAICVLLLISQYLERVAWSKERAKLLDRIQAHSLAEYKQFSEEPADDGAESESLKETELL